MHKTTTYTKTPAEVRREFDEAGVSVAEWARINGFSRTAVMDLLLGRRFGKRGEAHRAAVALGLKAGRVVDARKFKPAGAKAAG